MLGMTAITPGTPGCGGDACARHKRRGSRPADTSAAPGVVGSSRAPPVPISVCEGDAALSWSRCNGRPEVLPRPAVVLLLTSTFPAASVGEEVLGNRWLREA